MAPTQRVLVCGNSLFMAALGSSLGAVRGLHLDQLDPRRGDLADCVRLAPPNVLVFELGCMSDQTAFMLLKEFPQVTLIALDPETHRALVLSVMQESTPTTADLVQLIQEKGVAAQQG